MKHIRQIVCLPFIKSFFLASVTQSLYLKYISTAAPAASAAPATAGSWGILPGADDRDSDNEDGGS